MCQLQRYHTSQPARESPLQGAGKEGLADYGTSDLRGTMQITSWSWNNGPALYSGRDPGGGHVVTGR